MDGGGNGRHGWVVLSYFFLGALIGLLVTTISTAVAVSALVVGGGEVVGAAVMAAVVGAVVLYTHLTAGLKRSGMAATPAVPPASGSEPTPPPPPTGSVDRVPLWPSAVYFRAAALVGLIVAVSGAVGMCNAIASELFGPEDIPEGFTGFSPVTSTGQDLLRGLLITGVGLLIMWWHLSEARKREH